TQASHRPGEGRARVPTGRRLRSGAVARRAAGRDARAAESARLESVCGATHRGFESHSLRKQASTLRSIAAGFSSSPHLRSRGACHRRLVGPPARTEEVAVQILIVNFNLDGLSEEEFENSSDELAPAFAAIPGLVSKVWLADRAEGIFGGVYTFESEKAVDDYLQSDLFARVGSTPGLVTISVRRSGVLGGPPRVRRGLAQPAGV